MKFKDIHIGGKLSYYDLSARYHGMKIDDHHVIILSTGEIKALHKNKEIGPPEPIMNDSKVGIYRGKVVLLESLDNKRFHMKHILVSASEIVRREDIKVMSAEPKDLNELYIILGIVEKKFNELETLIKTLKMLVEKATEDNGAHQEFFMSSSPSPVLSRYLLKSEEGGAK